MLCRLFHDIWPLAAIQNKNKSKVDLDIQLSLRARLWSKFLQDIFPTVIVYCYNEGWSWNHLTLTARCVAHNLSRDSPLLLIVSFSSTPSTFSLNEWNIFSVFWGKFNGHCYFRDCTHNISKYFRSLDFYFKSLTARLYECPKQWVRRAFGCIANIWEATPLYLTTAVLKWEFES